MSEDRFRGVSVWFDCDISQFKKNPLMFDTPFGKPVTMARGNIFEERDELEAALEQRSRPSPRTYDVFHADVDAACVRAGLPNTQENAPVSSIKEVGK